MDATSEERLSTFQKRHVIVGIGFFWTILIGAFVLLALHSIGYKPWGTVIVCSLFPLAQLVTVLRASPTTYRSVSQLFASAAFLGFALFAVIVFLLGTHKGEAINDWYLLLTSLMIIAISCIYGCGITGMLMFYAVADIKENPFYNFLRRK